MLVLMLPCFLSSSSGPAIPSVPTVNTQIFKIIIAMHQMDYHSSGTVTIPQQTKDHVNILITEEKLRFIKLLTENFVLSQNCTQDDH